MHLLMHAPSHNKAALGSLPWSTHAIAQAVGAVACEGQATVGRIDPLEKAQAASLCFARSTQAVATWAAGPSAALLVSQAAWNEAQPTTSFDHRSRCVIVVSDADLALITLLQQLPLPAPMPSAGVHPSAVIHPSATIAPSASIGPSCVVEAGARIGEHTVVLAQCYIGASASIGNNCLLHPGVKVLAACVVGNACQLHAGVVLGADGFGYRPANKGLVKVPHVGNVVLGDDVEIGANSCIDRGKLGPTTVGSGTKIDNLVQIGHNVTIGRCCIICGNFGLAGSVTLGDGVVLGGSVSVRDNVTIASGAQVAATSAVAGDVPAKETYIGTPAMPIREWNALYKAMLRLSKQGRAALTKKS
jgi:UDP-3-O-[3-hydroxymyristoyl] glucosamine N-acyltransferase